MKKEETIERKNLSSELKEIVDKAVKKKELNTYIKDDATGKLIKVHPDLAIRLQQGETLTVGYILDYQGLH